MHHLMASDMYAGGRPCSHTWHSRPTCGSCHPLCPPSSRPVACCSTTRLFSHSAALVSCPHHYNEAQSLPAARTCVKQVSTSKGCVHTCPPALHARQRRLPSGCRVGCRRRHLLSLRGCAPGAAAQQPPRAERPCCSAARPPHPGPLETAHLRQPKACNHCRLTTMSDADIVS